MANVFTSIQGFDNRENLLMYFLFKEASVNIDLLQHRKYEMIFIIEIMVGKTCVAFVRYYGLGSIQYNLSYTHKILFFILFVCFFYTL